MMDGTVMAATATAFADAPQPDVYTDDGWWATDAAALLPAMNSAPELLASGAIASEQEVTVDPDLDLSPAAW
jgi:hypothetical protein